MEFYFAENDHFNNTVLTKDYTVRYGFTDAAALKKTIYDPTFLAHYEGRPEITGCKGCKINWAKGKNLTLRPVKKADKATGKVVTKFAVCIKKQFKTTNISAFAVEGCRMYWVVRMTC